MFDIFTYDNNKNSDSKVSELGEIDIGKVGIDDKVDDDVHFYLKSKKLTTL